jgi:hypothetical protein
VNNYSLTVEKGEGYDLNRSMFERLVLKGYPHQTLTQQHRMRPEISDLVRQLTYPNLIDAASTYNRPSIRGLRDVIVFVNHNSPEDEFGELSDRRDMGSSSSKQNTFEVEMVLKTVRYLGQQGYGTDQLVILTPYLGQLLLLKTSLAKENDPLLNDLDSHELASAGLLPPGSSRSHNRPIRLATIGTSNLHHGNAIFTVKKTTIKAKRVTLSSSVSLEAIPITTLDSCSRPNV